jgi:CDP-diacylglycerol--glycerol-3-phosphate 3-phosphatidyltransferase
VKIIKYVPNVLSVFRILFSIALPFTAGRLPVFVPLYLLLGLSDFLDGRIARHFHAESAIGAKLDGLGDTLLSLSSFVSVVFLMKLEMDLPKILLIGCTVIGLKVGVAILTRVRFKQWNGLHTYGNKALGGMLYFALLVCAFTKKISLVMILIMAAYMVLTVVDEVAILLTSETYNVDHKGYLIEKWLTKHRAKT